MPTRPLCFSGGANNTCHNDSSSLPTQLLSSVPSCAQPCLSAYIDHEYTNTCPGSMPSLGCLCTYYSSTGFTLGELAFTCLSLHCPALRSADSVPLYNICSGQPSAVVATHRTLTLPALTSVTGVQTTTLDTAITQSPSTTTQQTTLLTTSSVSTLLQASQASATAVGVPAGSAMAPTTPVTVSSAAVSTTSAATSHSSSSLTSAQAVGVTVAGMGAMCLAMGAFFLIACLRRRKVEKKKKRDSTASMDFVDVSPPRFSPFNYGYKDPRGPLGGFHMPRAELSENGRKSAWVPRTCSVPVQEMDINRSSQHVGRSISPESQRSNESMHTVSQLLPEKPSGTTPPRPPVPRPASIGTAATVFEEDRSSPKIKLLPALPLPPAQVYRAYHPQKRRTREPQFADHYTRSPESMRQPQLSLQIPTKRSTYDELPSPSDLLDIVVPPTPQALLMLDPLRLSAGSRVRSTHSTIPPNSAGSYLPNYYTSSESRTPTIHSASPIPDDRSERHRPSAITVTKPTYPPRAVRSSSNGSSTSFESTDPDEPTPPEEEERHLSPVVESPIGVVRYPKVPRSSNQSVPRSPAPSLSPRSARPRNSQQLSPRRAQQLSPRSIKEPRTPERQHTSNSTLAAKRRGDDAAHDLERNFVIMDSAYSHVRTASDSTTLRGTPPSNMRRSDCSNAQLRRSNHVHASPLKGYGREIQPEMRTPGSEMVRTGRDIVLGSPLWEPKLTPSRRGDDLILSVSVATPR